MEHWSCEATACVAGMQDHDNSEGGFEHEYEYRYAEYDCWGKGGHSFRSSLRRTHAGSRRSSRMASTMT